MVEREEVEMMLEASQNAIGLMNVIPGDPRIAVDAPILAALCRAWLAVQEAPQRMVGDGISYGVSVAGTGIANGQRVRIVKEVGG